MIEDHFGKTSLAIDVSVIKGFEKVVSSCFGNKSECLISVSENKIVVERPLTVVELDSFLLDLDLELNGRKLLRTMFVDSHEALVRNSNKVAHEEWIANVLFEGKWYPLLQRKTGLDTVHHLYHFVVRQGPSYAFFFQSMISKVFSRIDRLLDATEMTFALRNVIHAIPYFNIRVAIPFLKRLISDFGGEGSSDNQASLMAARAYAGLITRNDTTDFAELAFMISQLAKPRFAAAIYYSLCQIDNLYAEKFFLSAVASEEKVEDAAFLQLVFLSYLESLSQERKLDCIARNIGIFFANQDQRTSELFLLAIRDSKVARIRIADPGSVVFNKDIGESILLELFSDHEFSGTLSIFIEIPDELERSVVSLCDSDIEYDSDLEHVIALLNADSAEVAKP